MSTFDLSTLELPIVQAPMAGGPSTPELAVAVCRAGGIGFLAAGYKRADAVRDEIRAVRAATSAPFGINLLVPTAEPAKPDGLRAYLRRIAPEAERQGAELGEPRFDDDDWAAKLEVLYEERPAVASFTFGCPDESVVNRLHGVGVAVWVTVTNVPEAHAAREAGADGLVVQGTEAGGHRGGFVEDGSDEGGIGLLALLRVTARATPLPLIATGGIMDGAALAAVLCAGASAAQIGTALMLSPEAATAEAQRALLAEPRPTRVTRAFSGRRRRRVEPVGGAGARAGQGAPGRGDRATDGSRGGRSYRAGRPGPPASRYQWRPTLSSHLSSWPAGTIVNRLIVRCPPT